MPLITWDDRYSVNVREFDQHHQTLVGHINELSDAMLRGEGKAVLPRLLIKLINYTRFHFAREEELMSQHGYPGLEPHRWQHAQLTQKVLQFQQDVDADRVATSISMLHFLRDWLLEHVQGEDRKYGPFLNSKGIS